MDVLVPLAEARRFHKALQAAGVDSTLIEMPWAGHGFGGARRAKVLSLILAFLGKHLGQRANGRPARHPLQPLADRPDPAARVMPIGRGDRT